MNYKRILTIQDISCVGQCSMAVAVPILAACGHEACMLPTALLSTHTGGFGSPAVIHFENALDPIWRHWQENNITFDAILVGYLGSVSAIHMAMEVIDNLLIPGGYAVIDPAFADNGRLYAAITAEFVKEMKAFCQRGHIILPNITEASMLSGLPYQENLTENYVNSLLKGLNHPNVVLTGVGYDAGTTGAMLYQQGSSFCFSQPKHGGNFHGTGDIFAACFTGSLMSGKNMADSVKNAAIFTGEAIKNTLDAPAHWYGVKFEPLLADLRQMLK